MPALAAPKTLSRDDLLRLGQAGRPWDFLPAGFRALQLAPADPALHLLAAANLARLGLPELALEHIKSLAALNNEAPDPTLTTQLAQLRAFCDKLPPARLDFATLAATCEANLAAVASAHGLNLRQHLEPWREAAARDHWFRATDGNILRRRRTSDNTWQWLALGDARNLAERFAIENLAQLPGAKPKPLSSLYCIEGANPPWLLRHLAHHTSQQKDGYTPRLAIIQADALEFLGALASTDLRDLLAQPRLMFFIGDDAGERFAQRISELIDQGLQISGPIIPLLSTRTRATPPPAETLQHAHTRQQQLHRELHAEVTALYTDRTPAYWKRRYDEALRASGEKLRILIPTTRYSTYLQHASRDLADALNKAGFRAHLLIEPDNHSKLASIAYLRAVRDLQPDLVILINYFRASLGECLPAQVPFISWIQDALPHQFDARMGASQTPFDFLVGHLHRELFTRFGFSRDRALEFPIIVSTSKFHSAPVPAELRRQHECELAFVSHHSETPEQMHERLLMEAGAPEFQDLLTALYPAVRAIGEEPMSPLSQRKRLELAITEALQQRTGRAPQPEDITPILRQYALPLAERILRHQTIHWAADLAQRNNWRFHLYGRGWETNEKLSAFARGTAEHGEQLRAIYQCAKVHLHISATALIHQRIMECALSGGLPICRLTRDELDGLTSAARRRAMCSFPEPRHQACDIKTRHWGLRTADSPHLLHLAALLQRLGEDTTEFFWSPEPRPDSIAEENLMPQERCADWLFGDLAQVSFRSPDQLESIIQRAIDSPTWRDNMSTLIASRIRTRLTHEAFIARALHLIRTSLAAGAAAPSTP